MIPSLEGWPTKATGAPSLNEVRLTPLETNPLFQCLRELFSNKEKKSKLNSLHLGELNKNLNDAKPRHKAKTTELSKGFGRPELHFFIII